jgi:hypothetical protein
MTSQLSKDGLSPTNITDLSYTGGGITDVAEQCGFYMLLLLIFIAQFCVNTTDNLVPGLKQLQYRNIIALLQSVRPKSAVMHTVHVYKT